MQPATLGRPSCLFPTSLKDVPTWAVAHGVSENDAEDRFIQYAAMESLARAPRFQRQLVVRGAAAMRLFYGLDRRTDDLDVIDTRLPPEPGIHDNRDAEEVVDNALSTRMAFHFPDVAAWEERLLNRVEIQLSPVRSLLRSEHMRLDSRSDTTIAVADLHFLISEKMTALLTHHWERRKPRSRDLADISEMVMKHGSALSNARIGEYFLSRSEVEPRLAGARFDERLRQRVAEGTGAFVIGASVDPSKFEHDWQVAVSIAKDIGFAA